MSGPVFWLISTFSGSLYLEGSSPSTAIRYVVCQQRTSWALLSHNERGPEMGEHLSDAVLEKLGITSTGIKRARREAEEERTKVYIFVGTEKQAQQIASQANVAVVTPYWLSWGNRGKASILEADRGKVHNG